MTVVGTGRGPPRSRRPRPALHGGDLVAEAEVVLRLVERRVHVRSRRIRTSRCRRCPRCGSGASWASRPSAPDPRSGETSVHLVAHVHVQRLRELAPHDQARAGAAGRPGRRVRRGPDPSPRGGRSAPFRYSSPPGPMPMTSSSGGAAAAGDRR